MSCCRGIVRPILIIIVTTGILLSFGLIFYFSRVDEGRYPSYKHCAPSICGHSTIRYPFGNCGFASAYCLDNHTLHIILYDSNYRRFHGRVIGDITESSYYTRTLQIAQNIGDSSLSGDSPVFNHSSILSSSSFFSDSSDLSSSSVFNLSGGYMVGTILNCTYQIQHITLGTLTLLDWAETERHCFFYNGSKYDYYIENLESTYDCAPYSVVVPTDRNYNISADKNLQQFNQKGFQITWSIPDSCLSCNATGGRCYHHNYNNYCICRHGVYHTNCSEGEALQNLFY